MDQSYRRPFVLGLSLFALMSAPVLLNGTLPTFDLSVQAGNGHGNGNGNGNGGGNGGGGENGNGGDHGNGGGNGGGGNDNSQRRGHHDSGDATTETGEVSTPAKGKKSQFNVASAEESDEANGSRGKGNLKSQLGGLNSLNRHINGVMNSADPKMRAIREFIVASADLVDAKAALTEAQGNVEDVEGDYLALLEKAGIAPSLEVTPNVIQSRIDEITGLLEAETPPDNADELIAEREVLLGAIGGLSEQWDLVTEARSDLAGAVDEVAKLEDDTDADALEDAVRVAANRNRSVTDDMVAWASAQLGVGDADGLIDDYIARR